MWFRVEFPFNPVDVNTDTLWLNSPFPFCQAVYQDRLRKEVKKMRTVATVPFLSLISFQRLSSSPPAFSPSFSVSQIRLDRAEPSFPPIA